jgi:hypothetical protein
VSQLLWPAFLAGLGKRVAGVARAAGTEVWSGLEQGSL